MKIKEKKFILITDSSDDNYLRIGAITNIESENVEVSFRDSEDFLSLTTTTYKLNYLEDWCKVL